MDERFYYLGFSVFPGIGPMRFGKLLKRFGNAKVAWESSIKDLKIELGEKTAEKFEKFRAKFSFSNYQRIFLREGVSFITIADENYPKLLLEIKNPPFVLYIKSNSAGDSNLLAIKESAEVANENFRGCERVKVLSPHKHVPASQTSENFISSPRSKTYFWENEQPLIAIVGTRKITQYGREVTEMMTSELVNAGFTIVSGLALGVDAVAHKTAIDMGGQTIAVLGSGINRCYPSTNMPLYNSIISSRGAVVSEFSLGEPPSKGSFPSRNRIIAGLSQAVLVTEGAEDSGALITADYAFKNNRKVFAVPGPITSSLSKGPYKLIEKGAKLVTKAEDIIEELKSEYRNSKFETNSKSQNTKKQKSTPEEEIVLKILENEAQHFDEIVRRSKLNSSKVGSLLSLMEIKGLIKSPSSGFFSITP